MEKTFPGASNKGITVLSCGHSCPHISRACYSFILWLVSECFLIYHRNYLLLED